MNLWRRGEIRGRELLCMEWHRAVTEEKSSVFQKLLAMLQFLLPLFYIFYLFISRLQEASMAVQIQLWARPKSFFLVISIDKSWADTSNAELIVYVLFN